MNAQNTITVTVLKLVKTAGVLRPRVDYPSLRIVRFSSSTLDAGVEVHNIRVRYFFQDISL